VAFELSPALSGYDNPRATLFYTELLDRLRSAPGIRSAALAAVPILAGDEWDSSMGVEGHKVKDGEDMQAFMNMVSPGYFKTMNVPLLEGRDFRAGDAREEPTVAIVNRKFAEHFFPRQSAIGKRIGFGYGPETKLTMEIVGVAGNALYEGPREGVHRQAFIPNWGKSSAVFYLRTLTSSTAAYSLVRDEVRRLDAGVPVYGMKTLEAQLDETLLTDRLIAMLSAAFGLLATVLAAVGLYGVMAFLVARRSRELGIRLTLGAQPARVTWMVMREVLLLVVAGLAIGIPATYGASRYVAGQLYGVPATDPTVVGLTVVLLTVVSTAAGLIPARRAARIDPLLALRAE
jgi:predicted permease